MSASSPTLTYDSPPDAFLEWMIEQGIVEPVGDTDDPSLTFTPLGLKVTITMYTALKAMMGPYDTVIDLVQLSLQSLGEADDSDTTDKPE